ncbi:MAG: pyridoxamine 5'-phosphate oxidase [Gaiellales bacterium]
MSDDPIARFRDWFEAAQEAGVAAPEAMALATADASGAPSARMVLLRGVDERGFRFFTNYRSRKGRELELNPRAALLFHWEPAGRQVRVEGGVSRLAAAESDAYWATRPRRSRLGAAASDQSRPIGSRRELERRVDELARRYPGEEVPRPDHWGGYLLVPDAIEFWQHGADRLHDRLAYTRTGEGWAVQRLSP